MRFFKVIVVIGALMVSACSAQYGMARPLAQPSMSPFRPMDTQNMGGYGNKQPSGLNGPMTNYQSAFNGPSVPSAPVSQQAAPAQQTFNAPVTAVPCITDAPSAAPAGDNSASSYNGPAQTYTAPAAVPAAAPVAPIYAAPAAAPAQTYTAPAAAPAAPPIYTAPAAAPAQTYSAPAAAAPAAAPAAPIYAAPAAAPVQTYSAPAAPMYAAPAAAPAQTFSAPAAPAAALAIPCEEDHSAHLPILSAAPALTVAAPALALAAPASTYYAPAAPSQQVFSSPAASAPVVPMAPLAQEAAAPCHHDTDNSQSAAPAVSSYGAPTAGDLHQTFAAPADRPLDTTAFSAPAYAGPVAAPGPIRGARPAYASPRPAGSY